MMVGKKMISSVYGCGAFAGVAESGLNVDLSMERKMYVLLKEKQ